MLESKLSRRQVEVVEVDNSVPYPEAPEIDYNDPNQEHYRGVRDPEKVPKRFGGSRPLDRGSSASDSVPYRDR